MDKICAICGNDDGILGLKTMYTAKDGKYVCDECCRKCDLPNAYKHTSEEISNLIKEKIEKDKTVCFICGAPKKLLMSSTKDNRNICSKCEKKYHLSYEFINKHTYEEMLNLIEKKSKEAEAVLNFVVTDDLCPVAKFNDETNQMILANNINSIIYPATMDYKHDPMSYNLFSYDQIINFELLENGDCIASGGIGRAALGGALFGGAGAIVGAATREYKSVCSSLKIKVTVKDSSEPAHYIPFVTGDIKKSDFKYKERMKMAQNILSKLQVITNKKTENNTSIDKFDEIRKYKTLFDEGIISEEEYEQKKKQLLGL